MAGRIPEHIIQDIIRRTDIVRLFKRYTNLQKKGAKYIGLCPFHNEKTPSFHVDSEEGLYHCFGCKAGGNIFTLLKELEGLEFYEALELLSSEAGIDLSLYKNEEPEVVEQRQSEKNTLRRINELAAIFYTKCLRKARGSEKARDYLKNRGINQDSIEKWRIGYAPAGWENVVNLAKKRNLDPNSVELAGLIIPREGGNSHYDRFRNRLIFPVSDRNGRVIGFGARALDDEQDAKYLNSPETPIFNKGSCFYGLDVGRRDIRKKETAVIVEGYTDVIMAHQYGFENVIAVLGTALTEYHADILSKLCERVILLFDPDEAGRKSAERSIKTLLESDVEPKVSTLPAGLDPCDFLIEKGKGAFEECLDGSDDFLDFCIKKAKLEHDFNQREERSKVFHHLAEIALNVPNEIKKEMLIRKIADELSINPQIAFDYMERLVRRQNYGTGNSEETQESVSPAGPERTFLVELLTFLLANPDYQTKIAEEGVFECELFPECSERNMLVLLFSKCAENGPLSEADFLYMLSDPHQVKKIRESVEKENKYATGNKANRLSAYVEYMEEVKRNELAKMDGGNEEDDEWLKNYVEMKRKEKNKKQSGNE